MLQMNEKQFNQSREYFCQLQAQLAVALAAADGGVFFDEPWHSRLGQGREMGIENSTVFARLGINFSDIAGKELPTAASVRHPQLVGKGYQAAGVSLVAHPQNPHCPSAHMNVRAFFSENGWWFGGGMDLSPVYGYEDDCRHFHNTCKKALDNCDENLYSQYKKQCDEYFYLKHRNEMRGCGGVFFDDVRASGFDSAFAIVRAVGDVFIDAYLPIINRRKETPFGEQETQWQQHRRGRYVEFNLLYDRGTLFGLQSGGRADSILMSLPPMARWGKPPTMSEAEKQLAEFLQPRAWCA